MEIKYHSIAVCFVVAAVYAGNASASELVYQPVNPSFGGNALNSNHLLTLAETQNQHREESDTSTAGVGRNQSEVFVRQLQSRLLSGLAGQVSEAIFGEDAQESGEIVFGDQTITFERGLEFVNISILDAASGDSTSVRVPLLQANGSAP